MARRIYEIPTMQQKLRRARILIQKCGRKQRMALKEKRAFSTQVRNYTSSRLGETQTMNAPAREHVICVQCGGWRDVISGESQPCYSSQCIADRAHTAKFDCVY